MLRSSKLKIQMKSFKAALTPIAAAIRDLWAGRHRRGFDTHAHAAAMVDALQIQAGGAPMIGFSASSEVRGIRARLRKSKARVLAATASIR